MDDLSQDRLAALEARVAELERSNEALWSWAKVLPMQDSFLIELMFGLHGKGPDDWAERSVKIIDQIVDNARGASGRPIKDGAADKEAEHD